MSTATIGTRAAVVGLGLLASLAFRPAAAWAASTSAADRLPLFTGDLNCDGSPFNEAPPTVGFAVIQPEPNNGVIGSQVALKGAEPNAKYEVRLIQTPDGADCFTSGGSIETNGQGNGNAHVEEPLVAGTTDAFVFVPREGTSEDFSTPDYVFGSK